MKKFLLKKPIKTTPRSNLFNLEITDKGLELIKISGQSESIDAILSSLTKQERQQIESVLKIIIDKAKVK
jgi:DNA-binding MarR family transcriptional regulator